MRGGRSHGLKGVLPQARKQHLAAVPSPCLRFWHPQNSWSKFNISQSITYWVWNLKHTCCESAPLDQIPWQPFLWGENEAATSSHRMSMRSEKSDTKSEAKTDARSEARSDARSEALEGAAFVVLKNDIVWEWLVHGMIYNICLAYIYMDLYDKEYNIWHTTCNVETWNPKPSIIISITKNHVYV